MCLLPARIDLDSIMVGATFPGRAWGAEINGEHLDLTDAEIVLEFWNEAGDIDEWAPTVGDGLALEDGDGSDELPEMGYPWIVRLGLQVPNLTAGTYWFRLKIVHEEAGTIYLVIGQWEVQPWPPAQ